MRHLEPLMEGLGGARRRRRFHVYVLSDTGDRARSPQPRKRQFAALDGDMARPHRRSPIGGARSNTGFKAGNIRDFCDRWGARPRIRHCARCRQRDDGSRGAAAGAHHAGRSAARHPAEPGDRHAVDQRICAHLPVRHAARHALLHASAAPGGRATADPIGATTPSCGSRRSWRIASCRCCPRTR